MFPLPRAALCENERLKKTKLLSALKHLQVDREGTGDASESSLPRRKATPLCLERHWVCSSQQDSTACKGRAVVRVTIALWRRGLVWGLKAVVLLLYHVTLLPVTDMSTGLFLWQQEGGSLRKTQDLAEKLLTGKQEDPPYLDSSKMSQTAQCGCHQPLPTDWSSLPHPSL